MHKKEGVIGSWSKVPPHNIVKYPILKQSFLENIIFGKIFKRFGLKQLGSYYRTMIHDPRGVYPYMPKTIPNEVYLYDFHTHTAFSDGKGDFKQILLDVQRKKHLNGLAFTDHPWYLDKNGNRIPEDKVIHHSFKAQKLVEQLKSQGKLKENFITFPGSCEFFMKLDEKYPKSGIELIALGVSKDFIEKNGGLKRITNGYAIEFIEKVHSDNGLVIVPHPFYFTRANELLQSKELGKNSTPDAFEGLNYMIGFLFNEAFYSFYEKIKPIHQELIFLSRFFGYFNWMSTIISQKNCFGKYFNYPMARKIAAVGSSDAHFRSMVGAGCTMTRESIQSFEDLRNALKNKTGLPMINIKWSHSTEKAEIFSEIINEYAPKINDLIRNSNEGLLNKLVLLKIIIKFLSFIFTN